MTFVVHKEWLDSIRDLPIEQQDKIIGEFVRYGVGLDMEHENDSVVQAFVNILKGRIDYSKEKYQTKVEMSKGAGRKKKMDDALIYKLAQEGRNSKEIAELVGLSKSAVDHSEGWRQRKNVSFSAEEA